MAGHLFVVHGDLRALHCDHWLLPCDSGLHASRSWNRSEAWLRIRDGLPAAMAPGQRVVAVPWEGPRRPWPTDVAAGSSAAPEWLAESVRQFLDAASAAPRALTTRDRPLLALPIVGTGYGGKRRWAGEVLRAVLPAIDASLARADVDVALVAWTEEDFAAAQAARRALPRRDELGPVLQAHAEELARAASARRLVVFFGAGVSVPAGLPAWGELLDQLARRAGFDDDERRELQRLGPLDRAQLVANRLGGTRDALGEAVRGCLAGDGVSLAHALLAGLPVREFITTNYDDRFERACEAIGRPVARLPYAPASESGRWLLKMHGCVSEPHDIVLTWQDYARYAQRSAALGGIVQAMLITRHMLFVGFSLDDENFRRIVDEVRRALRPGGERGRPRLGSVVSLFANPLVEQLWGEDLRWVQLEPSVPPAERAAATARAARRFELFLDELARRVSSSSHVLNPRFEAVLTPAERELRDALEPVRAWLAAHPADDEDAAATRALLERLLTDLGGR